MPTGFNKGAFNIWSNEIASKMSKRAKNKSGLFRCSVAPTINKFSVGEHLRLGQRVSMLCSVTDGDLPIHLNWFRDDRLLIPGTGGSAANGDVSITEIGNYESVLRIDDLRPEHNANYTCVAENFAGRAQHSLTLRVKGTSSSPGSGSKLMALHHLSTKVSTSSHYSMF